MRGRFVCDASPGMGPLLFGSKISVRLSRRGVSMPSLVQPVPQQSQCRGVTRAGRRCTIRSDCNVKDSSGRAVAEPLRRGGTHCIFHATLFCSTPAAATDALLFYLDLETTGLNIGSDEIVEFGVIADGCGAIYSTVVHPRLLPTPGPTVHGIPNEELCEGPGFAEAFARLERFFDAVAESAIEDGGASEDDCLGPPMLRENTPTILIVAHNGVKFDFPMLLSECLRQKVSWSSLSRWHYADSLEVFRLMESDVTGGCVKLQCLVRALGRHDELRAHRALDDAIALRDVVRCAAEAFGATPLALAQLVALELDAAGSAAQISVLTDE